MKEWEKHLERAEEKLSQQKRHMRVGLPFVNEGLIEELYTKSLTKAQTKREKTDYDIYYEPSKEEAEKFLVRIKDAIRIF